VNFAISSLAMNFFEEYNVTVSSKSSGGEHDSTGLRAKQKLITPLLRCASPETATLYSELFETTQQNKKGSHRLPFLRFRMVENYELGTTIVAVELDVYGDVKLGGGGDGPAPNAGDGAGRATKRDLWFAARQGALSSGQG
jgi:hypothetical protein